MADDDDEHPQLRSVAPPNAESILRARERAEKQLADERERLRITLASIGDAVISTDADGGVTYLNGVAEALTGWRSADASGLPLTAVFHIVNEETRLPVDNPALRALRDGTIVGLANHTILIARDGAERPIDDSAAPIRDQAGDIVGAVLVFRDVTARKHAEQALRDSANRHQFLAELAAGSQPLTDAEQVMTLTARLLAEHLDVDRCAYAEIADDSTFVITGDHTRGVPSIVGRWPLAGFGPALTRCMLANEPFVSDDVEADPRAGADLTTYRATAIRAVICVPLYKAGRFTAAMAVHQKMPRRWTAADVEVVQTVVDRSWESIERTRVARGLRDTVERLALALAAASLGDWSWDVTTDVVTLSARAAEMFGVPPGPLMTWTQIQRLIHADDQAPTRLAVERSVADGSQYDVEYRVLRPDGVEMWVSARGRAQYDASGRPLGMYGVVQDITQYKRKDQQLRERAEQLADTDRKKDAFIALLAHELRNPLAPIRHGLQVMRLAPADSATVARARTMMDRQLGHMVRLIDDLLDVSRLNQNKLHLQKARLVLDDVVNLAVEAARPMIDEAGHTLTISLPDEPVFLDADLTRLAQVFNNLLTNSAKYTEPGGRIDLTAVRVGDELAVYVRDTGIGISQAALPAIFDMFSQVDQSIERSAGGLGIGLALVRGLTEMHGGSVAVSSPGPGQGSTFSVRLPVLAPAPEPADALSPELARRSGPGRRILVADDNEDSADALAMMLELLGDHVDTARDGVEAVEAAERLRPEIILMDMGMPRLNGHEATRRIRAQPWGEAMTIVALTGWGQEGDRAQSRAAGCDGHLVKPVSLGDLERLLVALRARR
jgi:PAS domain S-box-containing protein